MVPAPEMFLSLHRGTANSCIIRFFFVLTEIHGHSEQDPALGDVWKYWEVPSVGLGIDPCFSQTPALTHSSFTGTFSSVGDDSLHPQTAKEGCTS